MSSSTWEAAVTYTHSLFVFSITLVHWGEKFKYESQTSEKNVDAQSHISNASRGCRYYFNSLGTKL